MEKSILIHFVDLQKGRNPFTKRKYMLDMFEANIRNMNSAPYFGKLFSQGFQIGFVPINVLNVIPNNTPVKIIQAIYYDELGNEQITDAEELIQNKWHLWLWIHEHENLSYIEFCIPGSVKWELHQNDLRIKCEHRATLMYWVSAILNDLKLPVEESVFRMLATPGESKLLLNHYLKHLQLS